MSAGKLVGDRVQCPFHGFQYDASGRGVLIPANGRDAPVPDRFHVVSYPVHESHGFIWIWWGENPPVDLKEPEFFDDIDSSFHSRMIVDLWETHYSRAIENQLDVVHLPFVHRTTIGRGDRTLSGLMRSVLPMQASTSSSCFLTSGRTGFPKKCGSSLRSLMYLRFYQKFIRLPIVSGLANRLFMVFNRIVLHQDRRVVQTQLQKASGLSIGENLVQGDSPIAAYRMRRKDLIEAVGRTAAAR